MFSRTTKHRPIALAGITIQQKEIITPTPEESDLPAHTAHIAGGNCWTEKEQGVQKNSFIITLKE